ncbi:MAG: DUF4177 domain-containing protein [Clostridia bacterium]|nr:DUF4177 domain-containing protein [Clostridia bacterium]
MKRFEYKVVHYSEIYEKYGNYFSSSYQSYFNDLGKEGWELSSIDGNAHLYFFKREINDSYITSTKN